MIFRQGFYSFHEPWSLIPNYIKTHLYLGAYKKACSRTIFSFLLSFLISFFLFYGTHCILLLSHIHACNLCSENKIDEYKTCNPQSISWWGLCFFMNPWSFLPQCIRQMCKTYLNYFIVEVNKRKQSNRQNSFSPLFFSFSFFLSILTCHITASQNKVHG